MAAEHQARRESNAVRVISSLNQLHQVRRTDWLCELDRPRQEYDCSILTAYSTGRVKLTPTQAYTLIFKSKRRSGVPRGGFNPPPAKLGRPSKIMPNSTRLWKLLKIAEFRTSAPQDVRKKNSKILKLPPLRNCFPLTMTNKSVVIINSPKVPKIKNILVCAMKLIVPNYSCLQNPWLGGYRPRSPFSLSSVLNWICWTPPHPEQNSWVRHWRDEVLTLNN